MTSNPTTPSGVAEPAAYSKLAAYPLEDFGLANASRDKPLFGACDWRLTVGDVLDARAALGSALAASQAASHSAPAGWKLVPIKLTEEMLIAGRYVNESNGWELARKMWAAMLEAAPPAPVGAEAVASADEAEAFLRKLASLPAAVIRSSSDLSPEMIAAVRAYGDWITLRDGLAFAIMREGAALASPAQAPSTEPATYVQTVPDHCDRIVWRNRYYHLPIKNDATPVQPVPATSDAVGAFAIEVEKLLLAKLGRAWTPGGISIVSLIDELAAKPMHASPAVEVASDEQIMEAVRHLAANGGRWPSDWIAAVRIGMSLATSPAVAVTEGASEPRFFIEHGTIHDRATGKHITTDVIVDGFTGFSGGIEHCLEVLNSLAHPAAGAVHGLTDTQRLDALRENSWDLRCLDVPTGQGDADIHWSVIEHHMSKPHEREVGYSHSDDPRAAIDNALAATTALPTSNEAKP